MVAIIQRLYQVERDTVDVSVDARQAARQQQSRPLLTQLDEARHYLATQALPKSPLGAALRYLENQWDALQRYVGDGRLAIDNNAADAASGIF